MLLYKSHSILKKMKKIFRQLKKKSPELNIQCNIVPVISFSEGKINENRIIFNIVNIDSSVDNNILYDNLKYICKELNIKIQTEGVEIIREICFTFDFDRNIYKVYYAKHESNNVSFENSPITIYNIIKSNNRDYYDDIYKKYKTERNIEKYKFMKKYNNIINYRDYEYYLEKKRNKKIVAILLKMQHSEEIDKIKLFKSLFNYFNINNDIYNNFIERYNNILYIGFSKDRVNVYLI